MLRLPNWMRNAMSAPSMPDIWEDTKEQAALMMGYEQFNRSEVKAIRRYLLEKQDIGIIFDVQLCHAGPGPKVKTPVIRIRTHRKPWEQIIRPSLKQRVSGLQTYETNEVEGTDKIIAWCLLLMPPWSLVEGIDAFI